MSNGSFLPPLGAGAGNDVSLESIIRPFALDLRPRWPTPVTQGPNETAPEPEAYIEWGAAGDFESDDRDTPVEDLDADGYANPNFPNTPYVGNGPSNGETGGPDNPESFPGIDVGDILDRMRKSPQDDAKGIHDYDEIDRTVQRTKIWNPSDNQDFLVLERIVSMRLRGPKGQIVKFNFKPPPMPPKPDTDNTP